MGAAAETWRGIGIFKWPALGLIALAFILTPFFGPIPPEWVSHEAKAVAEGSVVLKTKGYLRKGAEVKVQIQLVEIHAVHATMGFVGGESEVIVFDRKDDEWEAHLHLRAPSQTERFRVSISITLDDGRVQPVIWDLGRPLPF